MLDQVAVELPFVDLDGELYKLVGEFDKRFPEGAPSMRKAQSLTVEGDWTFGARVQVVGDVELDAELGPAGPRRHRPLDRLGRLTGCVDPTRALHGRRAPRPDPRRRSSR